MSEHTIREILKRRSDDTQRIIRRRREQAASKTYRRRRSHIGWIVLAVIIAIIIAVVAYSGWWASRVNSRFVADRTANSAGTNGVTLTLQATSQFLPNTLLAATDPNFYNNGNMRVSPLTRQLVRLYFPDAAAPTVDLMALTLQFGHDRTDILETYINDLPFADATSRPLRGFAAASQAYFKKPFVQLQPQDVALLVALATGGGNFDPRRDAAKALSERNAMLQVDVSQGVLSQSQADLLKKLPLDLVP